MKSKYCLERILFVCFSSLCILVASTTIADACTSLLVTKGASDDNSCMITYTADSAGFFVHLAYVEQSDGTFVPTGGSVVFPKGTKTHRVFGFVGENVIDSFQGIMNDCQVAIAETTWG